MKTKLIAFLSSVLMILSSAFMFGACGNKEDGFVVIDGISKTGSKLYFQTKEDVERLAEIDFSSFDGVRFTEDNYTVGFVDNAFGFLYSFDDNPLSLDDNPLPLANSVYINLDKSYANLTPDKMKEKYSAKLAHGLLSLQDLENVAESGHLENILYGYKITYEDHIDRFFHCLIEAYVFKSEESLLAAADSNLFFDATFIPFGENYTYYENVLIRYFPHRDGSVINPETIEPTGKEINKIKSAINFATNTLNDLTK